MAIGLPFICYRIPSLTTALKIEDIVGKKNLPCMCMTFHVHERNHDSEKAHFSHREFEKVIIRLCIDESAQTFRGR